MILGNRPPAAAGPAPGASRLTIDEILRRVAARRPDALALADAANREAFTHGEPRRFTYAEAERIVATIAARLRSMGLPTDTVIGLQLPNIAEHILAMLGILRADMIVAPLPPLWRRADAGAALARVGAKALITCGHVGAFNQGQFAVRVAADVFSIRYVCGFGDDLADGMVPFDDLLSTDGPPAGSPVEQERQANAAAHVAAITFDIAEGGLVPVARSHAELLAGGLAVMLESGLTPDTNLLSTIVPSSFSGICLTLLPWLLSGSTLVLQHLFDPHVTPRQWRNDRCGAVVLPGPLALRLAEAAAFAVGGPDCVIAAWRAPERLATSQPWRVAETGLVDVAIFGEAGLVPSRRGADGKPNPMPLGPVVAPSGGADATVVAELTRTDAGALATRGPMVPHHVFPPGIERSGLPYFKIGPHGVVDTGYACRIDSVSSAIVVTGPPAGIVSVGAYRFPLHDLQELVSRIDSTATLAILPHPIIGQRLIGNAADRATIQAALHAAGVNPIVVAAFRDRGERDAA